jgi:outer membrane protein assembly factor BamA
MFGRVHAQIPDLPTLGENWTDVGYPKLFYTIRDGLTGGLYYAQIRPPGFRDWFDPQPYRASLAIDGQLSTSGSHSLGFYARMPNLVPGWRFSLVAEMRRRARQNYFGLGNNTEYDGANANDTQPYYYRADHHRTMLRGEVQRRVVSHLRLLTGFHLERWRFDTLPGMSLLALQSNAGIDLAVGRPTTELSARFGLVFDTRDDDIAPTKGVLLETIFGVADSTVAGALSYTRTTVSVAAYWSPSENVTFAGRLLGQVMTGSPGVGSYMLIEASDKPTEGFGGFDSHRGFADNRYLGEDKLLANLETRYQVVGERHVVAASLVGFVDVGRVFQPGEDVFKLTLDGMHVGVGGGPVLSFGRVAVLGTTLAIGPDGLSLHAMTDWAF